MATRYRIAGLASLNTALVVVCDAIARFAPRVRPFVPDAAKADWDARLNAILTACDLLHGTEYSDTSTSTNAPWGPGI
jgi:hypothetical protein